MGLSNDEETLYHALTFKNTGGKQQDNNKPHKDALNKVMKKNTLAYM